MAERQSERYEFIGSGGHALAARLDRPLGPPRAFALFAHCFTCSKDIAAASRIARALSERGLAVLRFDFTGLGHSDGEFANTNFSSNVEDLVLAADAMRRDHQAPALLIGHSLGGAAILAAAARIAEARAVATIGAPADPDHIRQLFTGHLEAIEATGSAEVTLAGRRFNIKQQFLDDLASQSLEDRIGDMGRALLVMHSPADQTVGIDHASRIFQAARHPRSFVSLDTADHLLTDREDATYAAEVLAAWADRYLPAVSADTLMPVEGEVLVSESDAGPLAQAIGIGPHRLRADEPRDAGGTETGPTPYDFLLAALGSCTSMTLRLYATRKKLEVEHIAVRLRHAKVHAEDCDACETTGGRVDRIDREIEIRGDLTPEQRQRMLEIADMCPVHRTLQSEVVIATTSQE